MNSVPKTVTRQRRDCDLNPGPSAPEFSTLTTRLPSHPTAGGISYRRSRGDTYLCGWNSIVQIKVTHKNWFPWWFVNDSR